MLSIPTWPIWIQRKSPWRALIPWKKRRQYICASKSDMRPLTVADDQRLKPTKESRHERYRLARHILGGKCSGARHARTRSYGRLHHTYGRNRRRHAAGGQGLALRGEVRWISRPGYQAGRAYRDSLAPQQRTHEYISENSVSSTRIGCK